MAYLNTKASWKIVLKITKVVAKTVATIYGNVELHRGWLVYIDPLNNMSGTPFTSEGHQRHTDKNSLLEVSSEILLMLNSTQMFHCVCKCNASQSYNGVDIKGDQVNHSLFPPRGTMQLKRCGYSVFQN